MTEQPLVCICIPTYNAASTVRETLKSILVQTYRNLAVHVSDNASTDNTLEVIESIVDPRVTIHRNDKNIGGEGNFNRCIKLAEGKYTAIFHADDVYEPEMVAKQVVFLEAHPKAAAVFTEASLINELGVRIGEMRMPQDITSTRDLFDFAMMFKAVLRHSNFFICPSAMVRTVVYQQEIGCWKGEQFKSSADLDLWLRILHQHPVGFLRDRLMRYRISHSQWSAKVRLGTARADFFLVTEHYLAQEDVRGMLDRTDLENYARLDRRDRVMRAVNCFLSARSGEAKSLLHDIYSWDAWKAAMQTKRGFGVLVAGIYLRGLLLLRLEKLGRLTLGYLKRVMRK